MGDPPTYTLIDLPAPVPGADRWWARATRPQRPLGTGDFTDPVDGLRRDETSAV